MNFNLPHQLNPVITALLLLVFPILLIAQEPQIDPSVLKTYQDVLRQSVEITKSTHTVLSELNSKKGKQAGGFTSEENKEKGMNLLRTYGDTRLAIESLQTALKGREGEAGLKKVFTACEQLHVMIDNGRNFLLDAYQFADDEAGTAKIIATLAADLNKMEDPKGGLVLKAK